MLPICSDHVQFDETRTPRSLTDSLGDIVSPPGPLIALVGSWVLYSKYRDQRYLIGPENYRELLPLLYLGVGELQTEYIYCLKSYDMTSQLFKTCGTATPDHYKLKSPKLSSINAKSKLRRRRPSVFLPDVWNELPLELRSVESVDLFKSSVVGLPFFRYTYLSITAQIASQCQVILLLLLLAQNTYLIRIIEINTYYILTRERRSDLFRIVLASKICHISNPYSSGKPLSPEHPDKSGSDCFTSLLLNFLANATLEIENRTINSLFCFLLYNMYFLLCILYCSSPVLLDGLPLHRGKVQCIDGVLADECYTDLDDLLGDLKSYGTPISKLMESLDAKDVSDRFDGTLEANITKPLSLKTLESSDGQISETPMGHLVKYGYLKGVISATTSDYSNVTNGAINDPVYTYPDFMGVPVYQAVRKMAEERCGNPDLVFDENGHLSEGSAKVIKRAIGQFSDLSGLLSPEGVRKKRYALHSRGEIGVDCKMRYTWSLLNTTGNDTLMKFKVSEAFQQWQTAMESAVTFEQK
eukprot:sb/3479580/